ncbi:hypothetical protein M426DRAFT_263436 [Hypoxylon sp. CI-4A]|nr:hypothetical protein M426DRAFT_263436 [Hypoxylon sp. CI-4A]
MFPSHFVKSQTPQSATVLSCRYHHAALHSRSLIDDFHCPALVTMNTCLRTLFPKNPSPDQEATDCPQLYESTTHQILICVQIVTRRVACLTHFSEIPPIRWPVSPSTVFSTLLLNKSRWTTDEMDPDTTFPTVTLPITIPSTVVGPTPGAGQPTPSIIPPDQLDPFQLMSTGAIIALSIAGGVVGIMIIAICCCWQRKTMSRLYRRITGRNLRQNGGQHDQQDVELQSVHAPQDDQSPREEGEGFLDSNHHHGHGLSLTASNQSLRGGYGASGPRHAGASMGGSAMSSGGGAGAHGGASH